MSQVSEKVYTVLVCTVFLNRLLVLKAYFSLITDIHLWLTVNSKELLCIGFHFLLFIDVCTLLEVF